MSSLSLLAGRIVDSLLKISPEFLKDQNRFLSYCLTWFLIAVRQEVKIKDISVVVHELELGMKLDLKFMLLVT